MKIVHLPDLHMGHPNVIAAIMHEHLKLVVYPVLDESVDMLVIGGDFFHTLLDMNSTAAFHVNTIIMELRELAMYNNFLIRIVRGTFSHDRLQNHFFIKHKDTDTHRVRLFQKPEVEYIEEHDLWILYKPDDLPYDDVWSKMVELIEQQHIDAVDIFVNHGYFEHLLPRNLPHKPHGVLNALKVRESVKGVTLNGHVHRPGVYENVISGGSFERLQHGEEEDKGFFVVNYDKKEKKITYEFIKNPYAPIFKTFTLPNDSELDLFKNWVTKMNVDKAEEINIRVITTNSSLKPALSTILHDRFPKASLLLKREKDETVFEEAVMTEKVELPILTKENLSIKIKEHIESKFSKILEIEKIDIILEGITK